MKFLVTGYKGQLGYDIVRELKKRGYNDIIAIDKEELDITDEVATMDLITKEKPDVVFHCRRNKKYNGCFKKNWRKIFLYKYGLCF